MSYTVWTKLPWQVRLTADGDYGVCQHTHTAVAVDRRRVFDESQIAIDPDGYIQFGPGVDYNERQEANAHLIAAAPEMAEVLGMLVDAPELKGGAWEKMARKVLAKARGEV